MLPDSGSSCLCGLGTALARAVNALRYSFRAQLSGPPSGFWSGRPATTAERKAEERSTHFFLNRDSKLHSKHKTPVLGNDIPVFGAKPKQVRILVVFQDRLMFSHIIKKVSARAFH